MNARRADENDSADNMRHIINEAIRTHADLCTVRNELGGIEHKLDSIGSMVSDVRVDVGVLKADVSHLRESVQNHDSARFGQLTWYHRTIQGIIYAGVFGGAIALLWKIVESVIAYAQGV